MKNLVRVLGLLLVFALVAAACGDDDDTTATDDSGEEAPADDGGEDAPADDSGDEAPADDSGEEAPADDGGEEAPADDGGEEAPADDGGDDGASDGVAAAAASAAEYDSPTDTIGPTVPLDSVPEPGKTVAWLACEVTCEAFNPGFEAATDLLGWNLEIITVQSFDPAPGFQQAIDLGADYIAITGTPPALVQDQIDAAAEAGIPIMSCYEVTDPGQEANNIWMQCGDDDAVRATGAVLSNKIIADTNGAAHELMVNIPDFPVLVSEREGAEMAYAENCPDTCQFTELPVTLDQLLAGDVPGAVVSALQSDPSITHVRFAFDALAAGSTSVLADAGLLDSVTIVGQDTDAAALQEIIDGNHAFWTTNPVQYAAFLMVDAMARHSIGQENTEERSNANLPFYFVDTPEKAQEILEFGDWPGPEGMADQFAALWGVG